jgi:class 3 adenylate cyclase
MRVYIIGNDGITGTRSSALPGSPDHARRSPGASARCRARSLSRASRFILRKVNCGGIDGARLMGTDEEGTHERLKAHLGELVEPKIKEYRGHTVKNTGDGLLAEFPSVVDAVRCAVEVPARHGQP